MTSTPGIDDVGGPIARLFGDGSASGMDEGELLRRFAHGRDPIAMEVLVARHGPMVLGVCRRVLGKNRHSSEDAFQATFLILARKAGSIRNPDRLGPWLHGVAHRVAVRARSDLARRNARERTGSEVTAMEPSSTDGPDLDRAELRATLDEEVRRLPEKFRDPIILCYLDGLTHDEAATRLHCPVGTVRSRLSTARARLRDRLERRGVAVPSGVFEAMIAAEAGSTAVSPALLTTTVKAATAFAGGLAGATAAGTVSAGVASLAEGVTKTMILSKLKVVAGASLAGLLTVGVGGVAAYQVAGPGREDQKAEKPVDETPEALIAKLRSEARKSELEVKSLKAELDSIKAELKGAQAILNPAKSKEAIAQAKAAGDFLRAGNYPVGDPQTGKVIGGYNAVTGMAGMYGETKSLTTMQMADFVVVYKPKSDKVPAYSIETGTWTSYEVPKGVEVVPFGGPGILALKVIGDEIGQIATYVPAVGRWFPIDLKEPAKGNATPTLAPGLAVYVIGRRVYAFSVTTRSWDILELPEGAKPIPITHPNRVTVEHDDHISIFSLKTGKWTDFDARSSRVAEPGAK